MSSRKLIFISILFLLVVHPTLFLNELIVMGENSHPSPRIVIENIPSEVKQFQIFTISVILNNYGEESLDEPWAAGIHLRLSNASFIRVEKGDFDEISTFSSKNNGVSNTPIVGSNILELWTDFIPRNGILRSGEISILVSENTINIGLSYRAWIFDKNDEVYCDLHSEYEPYISRDPVDVVDDRFNGLDSFLLYDTYEVSVPVNGLNSNDEIDVLRIDITVNPLGHADITYNFIYVCKNPERELKIWLHAPSDKLDLVEYLDLPFPVMTKLRPINVTKIQASRQVNGTYVNDVSIQRDGSYLVLVIENPNRVEVLGLGFRLLDYVNKDSIFYEFGFVLFRPNFVRVHSLTVRSSIQFSYTISSHIEYAILTHYPEEGQYQQNLRLPDKVRFINRVIYGEWYEKNFLDEMGLFFHASNIPIVGNWGRYVFWLFIWGCMISFALMSFLSFLKKGFSIDLNSYLTCFIIIAVYIKLIGIPYLDVFSSLFLSSVPAFILYLVLFTLQALSINVTGFIFQFLGDPLKNRVNNLFDKIQLRRREKWVSKIISSLLSAIICIPLLTLGYFWLRPALIPVYVQIFLVSILLFSMITYGAVHLYLKESRLSIKNQLKRLKREIKDLEERIGK